ncbi:dihydroorotate dehydrogenase (quinone), partial [Francisellaceae bacterium]|nr:dihydroorotate dehydrogenase (quinone) [Francisellaceae bacterium]
TPEDEAYKDYEICLEKCYQYADYITINISSPNTAGLRDLQKKDNLSHLLGKIDNKRNDLSKKHHKDVPIFVKIAPDITDEEITDISDVISQQNMDGVILTNTTIDKTLLGKQSKHLKTVGGLSGKPLFENSTKVLNKFKQKLNNDVLIIGVGGIDSPEKATQKINNGADLVQIYTGLIYKGPSLISKCAMALKR